MEQRPTPGTRESGHFDEAATARAVVDEHGIVTEWNQGARMLLGYRREEIVGTSAAALLDEDVPAETLLGILARPRWNGAVPLRHRAGHRVVGTLVATRRPEEESNGEWLVVSALTGRAAVPADEPMGAWGFEQSPCIMVLRDTNLRSRRANRAAERVFSLTEDDLRGLRLRDTFTYPHLDRIEAAEARVLETGEQQYVEFSARAPGEAREHAWSICLAPLRDENGSISGVVVAAHDITEQYWARKRLQLLSDAGTRIGSTLDVVRTAQELMEVAVPEFADFAMVNLRPDLDFAVEMQQPGPRPTAAGAIRLRRVAHKSVLPGVPEAVIALGEMDSYPPYTATVRSLAGGKAVLWAEYDPEAPDKSLGDPDREAAVRAFGVHSVMVVPLQARGTTLGVAVFLRHQRPDSFGEDDLLLAEEITARAALSIDNARQYTRERKTAGALQRFLLPQRLPQQAAVDVASRYLPTGALSGVGGDWFDVIPLSSARVALVVGDVVGHGIQASATMGRLRTAVRTLADVDLRPEELLTHLDDLVVRLTAEAETDGTSPAGHPAEAVEGFAATCLYAVYDPVSQVCTMASAGHPGPAVVSPDRVVDLLDVPAGPPLGFGGLPFEAVEFTLPEGSLLALYTDGLVESRDQDIDDGIARLRKALAQPAASLDDLCDTVLDTLPPERRADDIALLIARTHALDGRQVATWDVPADPAFVSEARRLAVAQLTAWDLPEAAFVTEILVSELVTNAIRHADPPIQLRLILDRHLICEVSDASSTAPHLRRARTFDEGGRGLLMVAQLARGWGTRQTNGGKSIWAEQALDAVPLADCSE